MVENDKLLSCLKKHPKAKTVILTGTGGGFDCVLEGRASKILRGLVDKL